MGACSSIQPEYRDARTPPSESASSSTPRTCVATATATVVAPAEPGPNVPTVQHCAGSAGSPRSLLAPNQPMVTSSPIDPVPSLAPVNTPWLGVFKRGRIEAPRPTCTTTRERVATGRAALRNPGDRAGAA